jgi:hypothetical protein
VNKQVFGYSAAVAVSLIVGFSAASSRAAPRPPEGAAPESCLVALFYADQGFGIAKDVKNDAMTAITAIANRDLTGFQAVSQKLQASGSAETSDYDLNRDACRTTAPDASLGGRLVRGR